MSPQYRNDAIEKLRKTNFDVLVVGGGITGVGCALDAASRGMSVALVEQGDIASGTSSRSSKLIHGGLRYLEQFQFALVKEALSERNLLLTNIAPHLVQRVDFLYPLKGLSE
ncbi:MAG TPA: glycerol-3-phosphate dehydrogenase, partial [Acidimicrobiaceae bacterium]|nr:glycerol-3-phosphate dehydrogenase [Acidimicrobiaceae bacterium]